jgi:hypothetical protein
MVASNTDAATLAASFVTLLTLGTPTAISDSLGSRKTCAFVRLEVRRQSTSTGELNSESPPTAA